LKKGKKERRRGDRGGGRKSYLFNDLILAHRCQGVSDEGLKLFFVANASKNFLCIVVLLSFLIRSGSGIN
jgi:hypothetical protein